MLRGGLGKAFPGAIDNTSRSIRIPIHRLNESRSHKKEIWSVQGQTW